MADTALLSVKRDEQKGKIWSYLRSKVGNYGIGSDDIWNLRFPLPPLDIQKQIVTKILAKRAEITLLRERATQIRREAEAEIEAMIWGQNWRNHLIFSWLLNNNYQISRTDFLILS